MPTVTHTAPHALSVLLTRFVAGEIAESALTTVCDLLEETPASAEERLEDGLRGAYAILPGTEANHSDRRK